MARFVVPELFVLRLGALDAAADRVEIVEQEFGPLLRKREHDTREPGVPISLRWALNPLLGLPRTPFQVWRRRREEEPTTPVLGAGAVSAPRRVTLPNQVVEIRFDAAPTPGARLGVAALSADGRMLPGQRLDFTTGGSGRLRAAGIAGLAVSGAGQISGIGGLTHNGWANLPDWLRIEVVGFPFDPGSLPVPVYDVDTAQGWEAPALSGPDAALLRLGVARALNLDPPPVGVGGLVAPTWEFPDPSRFLDVLRRGPLADAARCLDESDDLDPLRLQAAHVATHGLPGLHQPAVSTTADPATFSLRTTEYLAIAVQDGPVALGLGFGTTDLPTFTRPHQTGKDLLPPGVVLGSDEYLVTATFALPGVGPVELAAIGHREPTPAPFAGLAADETFVNRAMVRDGDESVAVTVSWSPSTANLGAGLISRRAPAATTVLNTPRPDGSGGFQPYLTEHRIAPDGAPAADLRPGVTLPEEEVPRSGSATLSYAVAPIDVHGRWGSWAVTAHTVTARPVQVPGVHSPAVALPSPTPVTAPIADASTLTVEVSWDWADRSCHRIEVSGGFVSVGPLDAPAPTITGFRRDNTAPAAGNVVIAFSSSGVPSVPAPATVVEVAGQPGSGAGSEVRRYRVTVPGMRLSFAAADELAFAVTARGAEVVRPGELSAQAGPQAVTVGSPFPAPAPTVPEIPVLWTAQADAAGRARTVLHWPAVPGAAGYTVWEATETALFAAVSGGGSPAPGPIRARALDLRTRVAANQAASTGTFSRLNERPLTGTSIELMLPGSADTLFAYRLATVTAQNIESARSSDIVLVAVPRREVPPAPRLEARAEPGSGQVRLAITPGAGIAPDTLRLHRVRRAALADQLGTMGPPRIGPVPSTGPGVELLDPADPSWVPYVYRAVATGRDLPDDGVRAADSEPSAPVSVLVAPPTPPLLTASRVVTPNGQALTVHSDLPWAPSPAGSASLVVAAVGPGPVRSVVATLHSHHIPVGPPGVPLAPVTEPSATRRPPVDGVAEATILLPPITGALVLTATDPLGRTTTLEVA